MPPPGKYPGDRVWVIPQSERWDVLTDADDLGEALDAAARKLAR
ncbi:hypothetical protein GCM10020221_30240 [Streptomyces thioluteus]|uniref:Uncharacterized protein n=1 Tax=Streptomyces thioluteus TaxID=66431 RepID=A0ABN3X1E1_STRTU